MLASRLHGVEDVRLDAVDDVTPGPGEVRVAPAHNGICGTDLHLYYQLGPTRGEPMTLGHEFAGVVDAVGEGGTGVTPGQRVCVRPMYICGTCSHCAKGLPHLCTPNKTLGCGAHGGGLAERCVMPADMVYALPDNVTLEQGALVEPMAVSFSGILRADVSAGARTVVLGAGPIGLGVLLGLRAIGVDDVVVVEPSPVRRTAAESLGATEVLDPAVDDVSRVVMGRTARAGVDAVFDCAGVPSSFATALQVSGVRCRVVVVAVYEQSITWSPTMLMLNEITVVGSMGYEQGVYERVIALMADGHYPATGWVEHIPWAGLVDEGITPLRRSEKIKVLVDVEPGGA